MSSHTSSSRPAARAYLGLLLGVAVASTAAVTIRTAQQHANSLTIAAWRLVFASLLLTPLTLATRRSELRALTGREWRNAILSGLLLGVHFAAWIPSVGLTTVAASVLLVNTHPLIVALVSRRLVGARLGRGMVLALFTTLAGAWLITQGHAEEGTDPLVGDLLALAGAVALAGYFLIGRQLRARLSLLAYIWPVYTAAAVGLMLTLLLSGQEVLPHNPEGWFWIALLALGPQLVGHTLLNWALRFLSATYVTLTALLMPVGAALLAWWLLGEVPSLWAAGGGALILAGVAVGTTSERKGAEAANNAASPSTSGE